MGRFQMGLFSTAAFSVGEPSSFPLNGVISGWTEGLQLMQEGSKYYFTIPHYLAYGLEGFPPKIGPKQTLNFEVELIEVL